MTLPTDRPRARAAGPPAGGGARCVARGVGLAALLGALLVVSATAAEPRTFVTDFTVRTTVFGGCTLSTSDLEIAMARRQTLPGTGSTHFAVACPGATATHPLPVRFTFAPTTGSVFVLRENNPAKQMFYDLCNDAACSQIYAPGVAGPVVPVTGPTFAYRLHGRVYPEAGGASPGRYRQQVNVTLTF